MEISWPPLIVLGLIAYYVYDRISKAPKVISYKISRSGIVNTIMFTIKKYFNRIVGIIDEWSYRRSYWILKTYFFRIVGKPYAWRLRKSNWKDVVKWEDVEFLTADKSIGKKMRIKKSGSLFSYYANFWRFDVYDPSEDTAVLRMKNYEGNIFLRYFDDDRVFCKEVADVVIGVNNSSRNVRLHLLEALETKIDNWMDLRSSKTMTLDELAQLFEDFYLNKQLVTLVPDPMFANTQQNLAELPLGLVNYKLPGPFSVMVCSTSTAIIQIFRCIISQLDWNCNSGELYKFGNAVESELRTMLFLGHMESDTYINLADVENSIDRLYNDRIFKARAAKDEETEMRRVFKCKSDEDFPTEEIESTTTARSALTFLIKDWIIEVIGDYELADLIHAEVQEVRGPKKISDLFAAMRNQGAKLDPEQSFRQKSASEIFYPLLVDPPQGMKREHQKEEKIRKEVENEWKERFEMMERDLIEMIRDENKENKTLKETIEELKKEKEQLKMELLKPCDKCYRTHQKCEEAKNNLKTSENKVKKIENKLEISEKMNKEYKEKEASIRDKVENEWKERFEAMEKKLKDEKEMKNRMQTITKENKSIKDSNEELKREKEQLKQAKDQLQAILEQKEQEIMEFREQGQIAKSEARLKDKRIEDLTKTYSRLIEENQKLKKTPSSNSEGPSSSQSASSQPNDYLKKLFADLVETKNRHMHERHGQQATEKFQKIKSLSDDQTVRRQADLELKRYNLEYQKFMDSLSKNISNLQSLMEFVELPDAPELSNEFMRAYDEAVARELLKELGPDELTDRECLICTENMNGSEKTLKCDKCRRRYHVPCVGKWLTEHTGCPVCKTNLRDLEKYPELAPYRS